MLHMHLYPHNNARPELPWKASVLFFVFIYTVFGLKILAIIKEKKQMWMYFFLLVQSQILSLLDSYKLENYKETCQK